MSKIADSILSRLGNNNLIKDLLSLPKSDFNSLMLEVFRQQAGSITPIDIVKAYNLNRFSVPSEVDPVAYHSLEAELLALAQDSGIKAILLSPAVPFASSSTFGFVNQNNVVSSVRGTEILSDPTNMLAIIIASQLKENKAGNANPLHYCTTARVLRAKVFPSRKGYYSHFGHFCIVSSGKDSGSYTCEKDLLVKHMLYYKKLFIDKCDAKLSIELRKSRGYIDGDGFYNNMAKLVKQEFPGVPLAIKQEYEENNYYRGIHFIIYAEKNNERIEVGGGGFVDWMQQMTNNKKERCLISGISLDRLLIYNITVITMQ
jgi:hypothetical protein